MMAGSMMTDGRLGVPPLGGGENKCGRRGEESAAKRMCRMVDFLGTLLLACAPVYAWYHQDDSFSNAHCALALSMHIAPGARISLLVRRQL